MRAGSEGVLVLGPGPPDTRNTETATVKGAAGMLKQKERNSFILCFNVFVVNWQNGSVKNGSNTPMSNLFFDGGNAPDSNCKEKIRFAIYLCDVYL